MRVVGAALFAAGLLVVPLASAATFGRPAEIPLVRAPNGLVEIDATQDGIEDLVLATANGRPTLVVLPGNDDGSFGAPVSVGVGLAAQSLTAADFDNDGADDVAVAGNGEIAIYSGMQGTLVQSALFSVPDVSTVTAADIDFNGNVDLIAASATQDILSVFRGTGEGTFLPRQVYATDGPTTAILVVDLNGDDLPDVVAGGSTVTELFNLGDGILGAPVSVFGGPRDVRALAGADLDGDGDVDVAAASGQDLVTVMLNFGVGDFRDQTAHAAGTTPTALGIGYVDDEDASLDIVAANRGTNDVSIFYGTGTGRFKEETRVKVGKGPVDLALGDLTSDGVNDLVTADRRARSVTVLLNGADAPQPVVCLVPRVARRTLAVARRLIAAAHCQVTAVQRTSSRRFKKGKVISTTPAAGARRPVDTPVTLLVSRGPKKKR
jgi:FG-GAP-like repeat/PASTA domain